ncbi:MAG: hypothetical protein ACD_60C00133G0002 [uncultured bacterium]|nr:MAG: hypothetical protein ACD_60C00133G0002 [uncultured bacterium]
MDDFPNLPVKRYEQIRNEIQSGDILLCSGNAVFSNLIKQATKSPWSHVAFILRLDLIDRIFVLESVESIGVRAVPLSSYVFDYNATGKGYEGRLMLARHRDLKPENMINLSKTATDLLGYPYHTEEIIRIAARISKHTLGLSDTVEEMPKREFICSEYAYVCFKSVGITIDYNPLGFIAPADFARCAKVDALSFIETTSSWVSHKIPIIA